MSQPDWDLLITNAMAVGGKSITAHTYRGKKWPSFSHPVVLGCSDGRDYVVKGCQIGKAVVNEQVVAVLGRLIGAPIPATQIVDVPGELISMNTDVSHVRAGLAHGSVLQENSTDKQWLGHTDVPENEKRFAVLSVLYGWAHVGDQQLIYSLDKPPLVWSVDHGHFFPGGPNWSIPNLQTAATATVNQALAAVSTSKSIGEVIEVIASVKPEDIATAVAAPPPSWAITMDERKELAIFIEQRRTDLLTWKP